MVIKTIHNVGASGFVFPGCCFRFRDIRSKYRGLPVYRRLVPENVIKIPGSSLQGTVNYLLEPGIIHIQVL